MPQYRPPVLDRRITLMLPGRPKVWANRNDAPVAMEDIGETSNVIIGITVWTIHERNLDGLERLVDADDQVYYLRVPPIERGGIGHGMRAKMIELHTERRSG